MTTLLVEAVPDFFRPNTWCVWATDTRGCRRLLASNLPGKPSEEALLAYLYQQRET